MPNALIKNKTVDLLATIIPRRITVPPPRASTDSWGWDDVSQAIESAKLHMKLPVFRRFMDNSYSSEENREPAKKALNRAWMGRCN